MFFSLLRVFVVFGSKLTGFELPFHQISSCLNRSPELWTESYFRCRVSLSQRAQCGDDFYGGCAGVEDVATALERIFPCVWPRFRRRPRHLLSPASVRRGGSSPARPPSPPLTSLLASLCPAGWNRSGVSQSSSHRRRKILHRRSPIRVMQPRRRLLWPPLSSSQALRVACGQNRAHASLFNRRRRARLRPVGRFLRSSILLPAAGVPVDNARCRIGSASRSSAFSVTVASCMCWSSCFRRYDAFLLFLYCFHEYILQ
jgi:hypothetical protein